MRLVFRPFKYIGYIILVMICLGSRITWASSFEITPFVGARVGGELDDIESNNQPVDLEVDDGDVSYGLLLAVPVYQELRVELLYSHQKTQLKSDSGFLTPSNKFSDLDIDYYHAGASWEWVLPESPKVRPFVSLGVGVTRFDPDENLLDDDARFSYSLGGGVKLFFHKNIALHLGGRFFSNYIDDQQRIDCNNNNTVCYRYDEDEYLDQFETRLGLTFKF